MHGTSCIVTLEIQFIWTSKLEILKITVLQTVKCLIWPHFKIMNRFFQSVTQSLSRVYPSFKTTAYSEFKFHDILSLSICNAWDPKLICIQHNRTCDWRGAVWISAPHFLRCPPPLLRWSTKITSHSTTLVMGSSTLFRELILLARLLKMSCLSLLPNCL